MKINSQAIRVMHRQFIAKNADTLLGMATEEQVKHPNSAVARVYTARALSLMKKFREAADILETVILPFPKLKSVYKEYLNCLYRGRLLSVWEVQSERFLQHHKSVSICLKLSRYFFKRKEWQRARVYLERARQADARVSDSLAFIRLEAKVRFHQGDFSGSRPLFEKVSGASSCYYLARIHEDAGRYGLAVNYWKQIPGFDKSSRYLKHVIRLCRRMHDRDSEITYLNHLLEISKQAAIRWKVLVRLEELFCESGDKTSLEQVLLQQLKINHGTVMLKKLADFYWKQERFEEASRYYTKIHTKSPFSRDIVLRLCSWYRMIKRPDKALQYLQGARMSGYSSFEMDLQLAELYFRQDRLADAKELLLQLHRSGRDTSRICYLLSRIYDYEGQERISRYYKRMSESARSAA